MAYERGTKNRKGSEAEAEEEKSQGQTHSSLRNRKCTQALVDRSVGVVKGSWLAGIP